MKEKSTVAGKKLVKKKIKYEFQSPFYILFPDLFNLPSRKIERSQSFSKDND